MSRPIREVHFFSCTPAQRIIAGRSTLVSSVVALTRWQTHMHTIDIRRPQLVYKHAPKRIAFLLEQCCVPGKATRVCRSPAKAVNEVSLP